ncbi:MAG TPA: DUF433 domain-containing protein [Candidatus Tectomicrobia bacterium]
MEPQRSSNEPHKGPSIAEPIVSTPGTCGGKPRIAGHRIRVQDIAILHEDYGYSPDAILHYYPSITLAEIHAALAYYRDHRAAIRQDIAADDAFVEAFKQQHPEKILTLPRL